MTVIFPKSGQDDVFVSSSWKEKDRNSPVIFCIFAGFLREKTELCKKNGVFETLP